MLLVPVYAAVRRRPGRRAAAARGDGVLASNLLLFWAAAAAGLPSRFRSSLVSIFGVMVVAQLWAFAGRLVQLKSASGCFP